VSLLLAYLIGASIIQHRARRRAMGTAPAAASWRRMPLALSLLVAAAVGYMTLTNMDLALRARCAVLSVEINSIYLATLPAVTSDAQNAAPLYEKAFAGLRDDQKDEETVQNPPTGNGDSFNPEEPATIGFLKHETATIALLRRAAALPACRFDRDLLEPDIAIMLPDLNEVRNAANVLGLDAREEIARGRAAPAIADAAAIFGMSRHFGERPLLISALVGIGIDAMGDKTLEQALPVVKSQDELASLRIGELSPMGRVFQQALRGEERYGLLLYGNLPPGEWGGSQATGVQPASTKLMGPAAGIQGAFFRAFILDLDAYIKLMENLQESATKPYYTVRDQVSHAYGLDHSGGFLMSILGPSLSRAFETLARVEAKDACAQTAVAMTRFRLDHGTLPSHLDDLVPAYLDSVPLDPFDGHPLRLAVKNDRRIIYSVGPELVDDGGADLVQGKGDIVFNLRAASEEPASKP
jgi:hypothetical protein